MTTLLWKELRENVKWGVLALLGLLMAEFYALNQQQSFFGMYLQQSVPLCQSAFLMITTFGNAAVGLVLGLVQMLPEQRRDQWAALLHRPVNRATIFRGKAVAGLLLYLVATIVPFAACVWYASVPGHFAAPFSPGMISPGVADICAGAMYYFAALFVSLQRGAWYGTRAMGVLAALSGSFVVTTNFLPIQVALETAVIDSLLLFTAAWGAMLTNGAFRDRPWLARFAALAVVFYGVCAAADVATSIFNAFQKPHYFDYSQYIVTKDGQPLLQTRSQGGEEEYTTLDGKKFTDPRMQGGAAYQNQIQLTRISGYVGQPHGIGRSPRIGFGYREGGTYASDLYLYNETTSEQWYFLNREQYFAGYNQQTHDFIGTLGKNGFQPHALGAEGFKKRLSDWNGQLLEIYRFGDSVYHLDVVSRTLPLIFKAPGISGANQVAMNSDDPVVRKWVGVALPDHLQIVDTSGKTLAALKYDHDIDRFGRLAIGTKGAQGPLYLQYFASDWIPYEQQRHMPSYLEQFDLQGNRTASYTLPPLPMPDEPRTWEQWTEESLQTPAFFYGNIIYEKIGAMLGSKRLAAAIDQRFHDHWDYTKDIATRTAIASLIFAVVAFVWAQRSEFSAAEAWRWALFVLAFNLAGLITFRLVADWPVRVPCPACRHKRRVDEPACAHCGETWPLPSLDGTEIMDEVAPSPAEALTR